VDKPVGNSMRQAVRHGNDYIFLTCLNFGQRNKYLKYQSYFKSSGKSAGAASVARFGSIRQDGGRTLCTSCVRGTPAVTGLPQIRPYFPLFTLGD
jgi:hypothetical protein